MSADGAATHGQAATAQQQEDHVADPVMQAPAQTEEAPQLPPGSAVEMRKVKVVKQLRVIRLREGVAMITVLQDLLQRQRRVLRKKQRLKAGQLLKR